MPTHRLCLLSRVSSVGPELQSESSVAPEQPPACVRSPGCEGMSEAQHVEKGTHQILVKRNEGNRLLKVTLLCEGAIFFYLSRLKMKNFKNRRFQKVKIHVLNPYSMSSSIEIVFFLIPSDIFLLHFLSYCVPDHILVVLIIFLLCFDYTVFLWFVSDNRVCGCNASSLLINWCIPPV